ncbi:MAG: YdcF family protein [Deltaproteobacteria bacterium]|nr:YdcF family protein [Deltaproteobacteria bacterium]
MHPIEAEGKLITKQNILRWFIFLLFIIYLLLSFLHVPILTRLGRYLILEHPPQKSDLIVCLAGGNIERGLAAVDAYRDGLAPQIFIAREELPDSYELLKERGIKYPESIDLMIILLKESGVPESAILTSDAQVKSTIEEATLVREEVEKRGFKSLIILTSPTHSRRAWFTYRKVFEDSDVRILEDSDVRILALPSKYSKFKPEDWWKRRRYVRDVIIEYQKLIFYAIKYFL